MKESTGIILLAVFVDFGFVSSAYSSDYIYESIFPAIVLTVFLVLFNFSLGATWYHFYKKENRKII